MTNFYIYFSFYKCIFSIIFHIISGSHLRQDKILKQINFVDTCTRNLTYSKNLTSCLKLNTSGSSLHQSSVQVSFQMFYLYIFQFVERAKIYIKS